MTVRRNQQVLYIVLDRSLIDKAFKLVDGIEIKGLNHAIETALNDWIENKTQQTDSFQFSSVINKKNI